MFPTLEEVLALPMTTARALLMAHLPKARKVALTSTDPHTQVGAVLESASFSLLMASNGGVTHDTPERLERPEKYYWMQHAEERVIAHACKSGVATKGGSLIVFGLFPCTTCARLAITAGIRAILAPLPPENAQERWRAESERSLVMLREQGVRVEFYGS